jgi:hypothetical protein
LKLKYDGPLSSFAFSFNLRRYTMVTVTPTTASARITDHRPTAGAGTFTGPSAEYTSYEISPYRAGGSSDSDEEAGTYTRSHFSST